MVYDNDEHSSANDQNNKSYDGDIDNHSANNLNNISEIEPEIEPISWKFWKKRRYIVVVMAFFGFFNVYSLRVNLSVAIVAMTTNRTILDANGTIIGYEQYFPWTSTEQGLILSSFFYGYIFTQIPGGYIGAKFGGNIVFGVGIFVTAILTLLTPLAAGGGVYVLMAIRIIEGFFEGVTYPCIHAIWAKWAPPLERSRMSTIGFAGSYFGTTVAMPLCGILAESVSWESSFYVSGSFGVIWFILWMILVRESPAKDPFIKRDELRYIESTLRTTKDDLINGIQQPLKYPWKAIFTSKPVYAIIVCNFCDNWGSYTLLTQLPTFLKDSLDYDLSAAGFLSAAPYLTMGCLLGVGGYYADYVQIRGWLTTSQVRKYFNCGAFIFQTILLMLAAYLLEPIGTIICITLAAGLGAFALCGYLVNHLDLAPQYASVLMGIANTFGTLPGIISPTLTGVIVQTKSPDEWRIVFYISSGVYLFGCIVYWFWSSGELQPWAQIKNNENDDGRIIDEYIDKQEIQTINNEKSVNKSF